MVIYASGSRYSRWNIVTNTHAETELSFYNNTITKQLDMYVQKWTRSKFCITLRSAFDPANRGKGSISLSSPF